MPNFFEGLLIVFMVFGFCVGVAIIVKLSYLWIEQNKSEPLHEERSHQPKIYLVKQTASQKKSAPRKRRSPKVAFEGLILKPENVSIEKNEIYNKTEDEKKISF